MTDDDTSLWKKYLKQEGVEPIDKGKATFLDQEPLLPAAKPVLPRKDHASFIMKPAKSIDQKASSPPISRSASLLNRKLDHRTDEKIRKGLMPIDATLDLHGLTQDGAYHAVCSFIQRHFTRQNRFLLIVTGKGRTQKDSDDWTSPRRGILKEWLPNWLSDDPCRSCILTFCQAQQKHGGAGAFYVYLRNKLKD